MTPESKACILLVDDEPKNLTALQALLHDMGRLVLAKSGKEALREVLARDFAVILLDARMPGMDGFEVARLIRQRERSRHIPIIFLTGAYEDTPSMFRGYEAGAVDYIVKPLDPAILRSKIAVFTELFNKNAGLAAEIAERKVVEAQLRQTQENLRALTARQDSILEEERTRISREIHDELGQALTGLKMDLTWLLDKLRKDQKPIAKKLQGMSRLVDETVQSIRRIASGLRPELLDEAGLAAAIEWQAKDFQMRSGIRCRFKLPAESPRLGAEKSTVLFRVVQEVLTNVARHSRATRVDIAMNVDEQAVTLDIRDNGIGLGEHDAANPKSLGILGMRERVALMSGQIEFSGVAGKGTRVVCGVPLQRE
jgi:signal transduction histidine kinase